MQSKRFDLVLLDIMMPEMNGYEVLERLKADPELRHMPVIMISAVDEIESVIRCIELGAEDYLSKPFNATLLRARVGASLETQTAARSGAGAGGRPGDVEQDFGEARRRSACRNRADGPPQAFSLTADRRGRAGVRRRKRAGEPSTGHRGRVLRRARIYGFRRDRGARRGDVVPPRVSRWLGALIHKYEGTLERFIGDGLMVLFNDPLRCTDPSIRAVRMAVEMRTQIKELTAKWRKQGHELGFGMGISYGYATLGRIGFEGRFDYSAVGTVVNLAARLCEEASDGQILIDGKVLSAIEAVAETQPAGELTSRVCIVRFQRSMFVVWCRPVRRRWTSR